MNVPAVALIALMLAIVAVVGIIAMLIWLTDGSPKAVRARRARRPFICPCGHDFVFHASDGQRMCQRKGTDGYGAQCACQGYRGEIPPATLAELLDGTT